MNLKSMRIAALFAVLFMATPLAHAAQESGAGPGAGGWMVLASPVENTIVIGRKPSIKGAFLKEVVPETVVIQIDGTDFTPVASRTSSGFQVTPPLPLPPGPHRIVVTAQGRDGQPLTHTASFSSRHTDAIEEIGSNNRITASYDQTLTKPSSLDNSISDWKVEANLTSSSVLREGPWKLSLDGVARYKDQELPIPFPERKGADIISYTARAGYEKSGIKAGVAAGEVIVDETPYTLTSLGRRGMTFSGDSPLFGFDLFSVRGDSVYGTRGGLTADGGSDRNIQGGSGTVRLFSNRMALKAVFIDGGEPTGSYNVLTTGGGKKGNVLGFRMTTDFFSGRLKSDFEVDFSDFNPDTSVTGDNSRGDHAFRAGLAGSKGIFSYEALFEHVGRDYEVVGNQGLAKNREGGKVGGSANFGGQTLGVNISRYNDNVKDDPTLPVNVFWEANALYGLTRWPTLPVMVAYKFGRQESDDVPGSVGKTLDRTSHDVSGQVSHLAGFVTTSLSGGYSTTDDRTVLGADTTSWNIRLAPGFNWPALSLTPSAAYSETRIQQVRTEIATLGLDGRGQFFQSRLTAELGGSWTSTVASDRSADNRALRGNFRVSYNPRPFLSGYFTPSVAFRGTYERVEDRITPASGRDEWSLFLTITADIPVVL